MKHEAHCAESLSLFGAEWEEVHFWLDAFAGKPPYGMRHRRVRHHLAGIEEIRKLFGDDAVAVTIQHIKSDLKEEGWTESDHFPDDEKDYVRMGLF